jgi:hypothetical protein
MENVQSFLASVVSVFPTELPLKDYDKENKDTIPTYNGNKDFDVKDARYYGAITYRFEDTLKIDDYAFPFDKNNFTFPIAGETVMILKMNGQTFWLPYTTTPYPTYRKDTITDVAVSAKKTQTPGADNSGKNMNETAQTGGQKSNTTTTEKTNEYKVNEKIKFLKPKEGDTIISGRVGNTIRFSEFFLSPDDKVSAPGIFIRNKQNPTLDSKPIGTLVEEDINLDGTSVYITSGKFKTKFKETTKKQKLAFKEYPSSDKLDGDQLTINSDRIIMSAKAKEFIIFGKGNTGIITDGRFSVDSDKELYLQSNQDVVFDSTKNVVIKTNGTGNVYLGEKGKGQSTSGAPIQNMVMGGELIKVLGDLIDEITKQVYGTACGPTGVGPVNTAAFKAIKGNLKSILSARNFLSK